MNRISVRGTRFIDEKGRERVFNGYNVVYKGVAADADGVIRYKTPLDDTALATLAARGTNVIRLGLTWACVEPEPEAYNEVYLGGYRDTVLRCAKYGIYVLVDFHQDLFSAYCYCGDGAPAWACRNPAFGRKQKLIWAEGYFFSHSVQASFDAFWRNEPVRGRGLRDRYCDMLAHTVRFLRDCPNVLGYDVFNEPFPGTPGRRIGLRLARSAALTLGLSRRVDRKKLVRDALGGRVMDLLSALDDPVVYRGVIDGCEPLLRRFDEACYAPFLTACLRAIRREDPTVVVFGENSYFSNLGIPCAFPHVTGEDGAPDPAFAFAPHGYDMTVDTPLTNEASPHRVDFIFDEHRRKQLRMKIPVLVGEWGGMVPGGERYPALEHLIDKFDRNGWSQTYWHYGAKIVEGKIGDILARPYPMAVAGEIRRYGYDRKNDVFDLSYAGDPAVHAPTLIWLPKAPAKVYSTKKYVLREEAGAYVLQVYAGKGPCAVKVEF